MIERQLYYSHAYAAVDRTASDAPNATTKAVETRAMITEAIAGTRTTSNPNRVEHGRRAAAASADQAVGPAFGRDTGIAAWFY
jgi:hypothetical protein